MWFRLKQLLFPNALIPEHFKHKHWPQIRFLAIDLELTSLDVTDANILSIGWVEGQANTIALESCYYNVITTNASLNQSPIIHGLVDDQVAQGEPVQNALQALKSFAETHVWVFHNTDLDMSVLNKVFTKLDISLPKVVTLDTLRIALYQIRKSDNVPAPNAATLTSCRQRHNLPLAPAHNALDDAVATMELAFAQLNQLDAKGQEPLSALTSTGALRVYEASTE
ncbi:3'-5' exonuclease [Aliiglaciecola lipolytica]|uniref:DNA polymerase III subunit epsilon n=1 Tax=Aliiglaciecola lipolytica E3 TaxID=1127673 RepID=K6XVU1_9ALTE|nr:3'-5' exonuclease [Aliiglaciecola lipolytica]GAC15771.1 DNA polymerase III subunit epsilon [Aliiglaciecola lipolytica E3]